jgi:hypothetical protein
VSALVLDAGALVAIDRDDRDVHKTVTDAHRIGAPVRTNSMAVAQVWRDSKGRQAELARVLRGVTIKPVTAEDGRKAGELLAAAGLTDAIDAPWRCLPTQEIEYSPVTQTTCGGCAKRQGTTPGWFAADHDVGMVGLRTAYRRGAGETGVLAPRRPPPLAGRAGLTGWAGGKASDREGKRGGPSRRRRDG